MPPQTTVLRLYLTVCLLCFVVAHPLHLGTNAGLHRGLGSLFGDEDDDLIPSDSEIDTPTPQPSHLITTSNEGLGVGGLFTAIGTHKPTTSIQATVSSASRTAGSPESSGPEINESSTPTTSSPSTTTPSATITIGVTKEAPSTPPGEAAEWKVIGIAALGIGIVAAVMLSIVFFDSWSGFLLALVGKRKKDTGREDMVPDWARRDWEFKIASEDGHRYPTLSSLESMTKTKQDLPPTSPLITLSPDPRHHLVPMRPPSLYLPALDPHPLEPLFRRPSATNRPILHEPIFRP
ncbi:hypothetical protein C8R43DRAFT_992186 [Mycena crocata]|nr:hypothetical protein C8R43DRAFT_992186 [Mycena crocata]